MAHVQVSMVQDEEPSDLLKAGNAVPSVFALGDCCADLDHPLPALAQVGPRWEAVVGLVEGFGLGSQTEGAERWRRPATSLASKGSICQCLLAGICKNRGGRGRTKGFVR